ncbi:MAG: cupin domain-containing protein [Candidatus Methylomirabilota bacterium]
MPFFQLSDIQEAPLINGITIKGISGENISVSFLEFPPFARIPPHRHPNEQIGIVEDGELEYTIGDRTMVCRKGMAFLVPPNTTHSAAVVSEQPVRLVDVFTPPRQFTEPLKFEER